MHSGARCSGYPRRTLPDASPVLIAFWSIPKFQLHSGQGSTCLNFNLDCAELSGYESKPLALPPTNFVKQSPCLPTPDINQQHIPPKTLVLIIRDFRQVMGASPQSHPKFTASAQGCQAGMWSLAETEATKGLNKEHDGGVAICGFISRGQEKRQRMSIRKALTNRRQSSYKIPCKALQRTLRSRGVHSRLLRESLAARSKMLLVKGLALALYSSCFLDSGCC